MGEAAAQLARAKDVLPVELPVEVTLRVEVVRPEHLVRGRGRVTG